MAESLEEQLVREGGLILRELAKAGGPEHTTEQRRQALELLLHLGTLHDPVPEWIGLAQRELLEPEVALLPDQGAMQRLIAWFPRLALDPKAKAAVELSCIRAQAALELLEHQSTPSPSSSGEPKAAPPPPQKQQEQHQAVPQFSDVHQLLTHLQQESANWISHHVGGDDAVALRLELQPGAPAVRQAADALTLNLAPLMAFGAVEQLDQLLPAFFAPLQAERSERFLLQEPNGGVYGSLTQLWLAGGQLEPRVFPSLVYASELWSRCGGAKGLGAQEQAWTLPVAELQPGCCCAWECGVGGITERPVPRDELEDALVEIRRTTISVNGWSSMESVGGWNPLIRWRTSGGCTPMPGSMRVAMLRSRACSAGVRPACRRCCWVRCCLETTRSLGCSGQWLSSWSSKAVMSLHWCNGQAPRPSTTSSLARSLWWCLLWRPSWKPITAVAEPLSCSPA